MATFTNGSMYQGGFEPEDDNSNGLEAFATLNQFLEQDGWRPQIIEGRYAYRTYYSGKNGELQCYAQIRVLRPPKVNAML